jgi:hypothetical protein
MSAPQYRSTNSRSTFFIVPKPGTFEAAELACQMGGGHLASFTSGAEQVSSADSCQAWSFGQEPYCATSHRLLQPAAAHTARCTAPQAAAENRQGIRLQGRPLNADPSPAPLACLQTEVEKFFTDTGYWFPTNFQFYWMGLEATNWPTFQWTDNMVLGPNATSYRHWGT